MYIQDLSKADEKIRTLTDELAKNEKVELQSVTEHSRIQDREEELEFVLSLLDELFQYSGAERAEFQEAYDALDQRLLQINKKANVNKNWVSLESRLVFPMRFMPRSRILKGESWIMRANKEPQTVLGYPSPDTREYNLDIGENSSGRDLDDIDGREEILEHLFSLPLSATLLPDVLLP